jgi:predicted AAA+ superfamily ATPase
MLPRRLQSVLSRDLGRHPAVALLGPRQVGKTTLAKMPGKAGASNTNNVEYLDLENPADLSRLDDSSAYLRQRREGLLIIDEVQRLPGLFAVLRGVIDERIQQGHGTGHFLLLGSASIELLKQSSETLAGRIAYRELAPIDVLEAGTEQQSDLWVRGGFPRSLLALDDETSVDWRANFVTTYLERDIPQLGPRIPATTLRRFWTMLAHRQGAPFNAAELGRSLGLDAKTVTTYLDLMVDLLLVYRLPPLQANVSKRLVKTPKTYIRDSGLVHTLLRLDTMDDILGHPVAGASWEGHVICNLLRIAPSRAEASYYRTASGNEIDLVLDLPGNRRWAIEVKRSTAPTVSKGFYAAIKDVQPDSAFVVYPGVDRYSKGEGVEAIGLIEMGTLLSEF